MSVIYYLKLYLWSNCNIKILWITLFLEKIFGARHVQYILLFSVTVLGYGLRNILNVAVIAMTSNNPPEGVKVSIRRHENEF